MATYLTLDLFKGLTVIPDKFVDDVERSSPGWVATQISAWTRWLDARLRKRYGSPFNAYDATPDPTPEIIQIWLARIVTPAVMFKRGVDSDDLQYSDLREEGLAARAEVLEAANSEDGWFDLPLKTSADGSLIDRGNPQAYSEQSPYVSTDRRRATGASEDSNGTGSSV